MPTESSTGEPGIRIFASLEEVPEHLRLAMDRLLGDAAAEYKRFRQQQARRTA